MALVPHFVTPTGTDTWANSAVYTTPCSLSTAITNATAGDKVWILQGNYTRTASDTFARGGTVGSGIVWQGCSSFNTGTPTPSTYARTNGCGPLITTDMPVIAYDSTYVMSVTGAWNQINSVVITGTKSGILCNLSGLWSGILNSAVTNAGNNAAASAICLDTSGNYITNCNGFNTGATNSGSVITINTGGRGDRLYAKNSSSGGTGVFYVGVNAILADSIACASAGYGVYLVGGGMVKHCTIYGQAVAAIQTPNGAATRAIIVTDCMLTDSGRAFYNPYNATAAHTLVSVNNRFRDNVAADLGFGDSLYQDSVLTDAGGPETDYVSAATGDFRLAAASVVRNAALGGGDIGACQRVEDYPAAANLLDSATCDSGAVVGTYHAPGAAEVIDTAVFGPSSGTSGTVHQPEAGEVVNTAVFGPASAISGTYPTTAASKAAQLADDVAAVQAKAAFISIEAPTILTVPGELDVSNLTPKAGVVGPDYVIEGHENYTGGEPGNYVPTTPETTKKGTEFGANGVEVGTFDGSTSVEMTANEWFNVVETARSDEWRLKIEADSWDHLDLFPEVRVEIGESGFSLNGNNILTSLKNILLAFKESGRFMVARIHASNYPVVLSLNNGSGAVTQNITDSQDVLILTPGTPAREWTLDITGANEIYSVMLAGETAALVQDGFVGLSRVDSPPTWLCRQIYSPVPVAFSCARVVSRSASPALVFKIYRENSTTASGTTGWTSSTLTNCNAFRLPRLEPSRFWRVDISGADSSDIVDEVRLATSMERLK